MKQWEYQVHTYGMGYKSLEEFLMDEGAAGWELVAISHGLMFFKRERINVAT